MGVCPEDDVAVTEEMTQGIGQILWDPVDADTFVPVKDVRPVVGDERGIDLKVIQDFSKQFPATAGYDGKFNAFLSQAMFL